MKQIERTSIENATINLIKEHIETLRKEKNKNRYRSEYHETTRDIIRCMNWKPAIETLDVIATQENLDIMADARKIIRAATKMMGAKLLETQNRIDWGESKDEDYKRELDSEYKILQDRVFDCADEIAEIIKNA